ncbi:MAG TPA: BON domain-containing protein [Tepidiformaceae bacterium]|nr:BON domain-containing protein [Tepidiformaceae bacterium]
MSALTDTLEAQLANDAGLYLAVEEDGDSVVLSGMITSENQRLAALDIAGSVAPGRPVVDNMEIDTLLPQRAGDVDISETEVAGFAGSAPDTEENESLEPGDFMDQRPLTDPLAASGAGAAELDYDGVAEGGDAYVPPIDPVGTDEEVLGGFETSTDSLVASMDTSPRGDEQLADEARTLLRDDAATADLRIEVEVEQGRAHLFGAVPTIDESDMAAEVVGRVPGIIEVVDELEVEGGRYR